MTTLSMKNAEIRPALGPTMKKALLVLYKALAQRDRTMTLREIMFKAEGIGLGYRRKTFDKSIRKLRRLN